jgi:hypothetical protein
MRAEARLHHVALRGQSRQTGGWTASLHVDESQVLVHWVMNEGPLDADWSAPNPEPLPIAGSDIAAAVEDADSRPGRGESLESAGVRVPGVERGR